MSLSYYYGLNKVKPLLGGHKSKNVWLLEKDIVRKTYDSKLQKHRDNFAKEISILTHLAHCPFVPKLLAVDPAKYTFFMNYTGKNPPDTSKTQKKLSKKLKELHLHWNVIRERKGKPYYVIFTKNSTIKKGKLFIIDFGSKHYRIVGPQVMT
jgi:tRNA A-37 threonylcarbamoyl transferase component Bud32